MDLVVPYLQTNLEVPTELSVKPDAEVHDVAVLPPEDTALALAFAFALALAFAFTDAFGVALAWS